VSTRTNDTAQGRANFTLARDRDLLDETLRNTPQLRDRDLASIFGFSESVIARMRKRIERPRLLITDID